MLIILRGLLIKSETFSVCGEAVERGGLLKGRASRWPAETWWPFVATQGADFSHNDVFSRRAFQQKVQKWMEFCSFFLSRI